MDVSCTHTTVTMSFVWGFFGNAGYNVCNRKRSHSHASGYGALGLSMIRLRYIQALLVVFGFLSLGFILLIRCLLVDNANSY